MTEVAEGSSEDGGGVGEGVEFVIKGSSLQGLSYEPLFNYFKHKESDGAFRVLLADFVTTEDGTGVVHIAPAFGEDDHALCKQHKIPTNVCPVDDAGKFTSEVADYCGLQVFDANDKIIISLKERGAHVKTESYQHNYPHCWRTDTPLIYKAISSWYVKVTDVKEKMLADNSQINWIPEHVKDGLFGKWLEGARDWSISRKRFWGCPVPVWRSTDPKYPRIDVYGSLAELEADFGIKVESLHRPHIDSLTRPNPDDPTGKSLMVRVPDVLDCWFESGSMPYASVHYPFENKEWFERHFPADFIVEYTAQTRGWFYTLTVLAAALFDKPAFLNCICHGVILDEKSQKLSKRLQNYPDPKEMFDVYGSDAMRWFMLRSTVMRGQELNIDKGGDVIKDMIKIVIKPLYNAYSFFALYASADGVRAELSVESVDFKFKNLMDRYIMAKLKDLVLYVQASMDAYSTALACEAVEGFLEVLNNWYIRRNKERFWKSELDEDKQDAYNTLYTVLITLCKVIAPLLPFVAEDIYLYLV